MQKKGQIRRESLQHSNPHASVVPTNQSKPSWSSFVCAISDALSGDTGRGVVGNGELHTNALNQREVIECESTKNERNGLVFRGNVTEMRGSGASR